MDIGNILSESWNIIWKHKVLWLFGILAGLGNAASSSGGNGGLRYEWHVEAGELPPNVERFLDRISGPQVALFALSTICVGLLLAILFIFLSTVGRAGLIRGVLHTEQAAEKLAAGKLFREGMHYFWRVFGLELLALAILIIVIPLIGLPLIILTCGLGLLAVALFVIGIKLVTSLAVVAIVSDDVSISEGIQRAWEMTKTRLGEVIVMALILFVGLQLIGGFLLAGPMALVAGPFVLGLLGNHESALWGGLVVSLMCLVAFLPVLILANGILRSFIETAWTLTYLKLKPQVIPASSEDMITTMPGDQSLD